jgi:hypothetical protein
LSIAVWGGHWYLYADNCVAVGGDVAVEIPMSWIEEKFIEQRAAAEERRKQLEEEEAKRRALQEKYLALWGRLIHSIEQDVQTFNRHPEAPRKLLVTMFDHSVELHWEDNYGPLLLVELNMDQEVIKYSTPVQQPGKWRAHLGEIKFGSEYDLLIPNGASTTKRAGINETSRFLLEPVLF